MIKIQKDNYSAKDTILNKNLLIYKWQDSKASYNYRIQNKCKAKHEHLDCQSHNNNNTQY